MLSSSVPLQCLSSSARLLPSMAAAVSGAVQHSGLMRQLFSSSLQKSASAEPMLADDLDTVESSPYVMHEAEYLSPVPEQLGRIHSTESFSAVDGPGIRFITFLQGCAMRCSFCSNPDTWHKEDGQQISSKTIAAEIHRLVPYLRSSRGGITCSGGEPLLQPHFTAALLQEAHHMGLTTCIDTTGQGSKHHNWDIVLPHTDMVLLCVKHMDPERYRQITGLNQAGVLKFINEIREREIPFWARYVLVPGLTDDEKGIDDFIALMQKQPNFQAVELLPYHMLGRQKWSVLGLKYPLEGVKTPEPEAVLKVIERMEAAGLQVQCEYKDKH